MKENNISTLRDHLFETLDALKDEEKPMDIERAKAVADVAQVIINSAKVEVDHLKQTGGTGTDFIEDKPINGPVSLHKLRG